MRIQTIAMLPALLCLAILPCAGAWAAEPCEPVVGQVASAEGAVQVQRATRGSWQPITIGEAVCQGDSIRTGDRSRAALTLSNEAVLRLDQDTTLQLQQVAESPKERSLLDLIRGALQSFSRKPRLISVNTPFLNGTIEGTEFALRVDGESTSLTVLEGTVRASNPQGETAVTAGGSVLASSGQAPRPDTRVNPRDAVQWSLYYPPILTLDQLPTGAGRGGLGESDGPAAMLAVLDQVPESDRDASFHTYRAALLLATGQVEAARRDIAEALKQDPGAGLAYALRSVIAVTRNQRQTALEDARQAVALDDNASTRIALSYALQADFRLQEARETLLVATVNEPDNALAWARLGELELMLGQRRAARAAADRSVSLAPQESRAHLVQGFAALAEFRPGDAAEAFQLAIDTDAANPLAHLGLGLAEISRGRLAQGRQRLEVAVALDSENALLRAYLGKAYFEERRAPLDMEQFEIAKALDPLDPTAFLYAGIALQSGNRPVEALENLETSAELNDNRAVYRGRLLLDKDRAARGTSQARVHNDLGFRQLGINETAQSLALDPSNAAAHRFLSDTFRNTNRQEITRVSELLQAQMLQDVNINPVQPSISATNLNIITLGGPATPGFNEFTPLFQRNKGQFNASGFWGNNETYGGEAVLSGLFDNFSFSAGAFSYDTDGFRDNNDLSHDIYDLYTQVAVTPWLNLQGEFGRRESDRGDLAMRFDPDDFDPTFERSNNETFLRAGARITPAEHSNVLLSFIHGDRNIQGGEEPLENLTFDTESKDDSKNYEAQYIYQGQGFNLTAGGSYADVDRDDTIAATLSLPPPFGDIPLFSDTTDINIDDKRAYLYGNAVLPAAVTWTLGVSYEDYEENAFDVNRTNPKFGVQWDITRALRLRGAWFKAVKPVLASNRTLEPTQVAGFSQYFDDADATKSERYGGALDWRAHRKLFLGAELTRRNLDTPIFAIDGGVDFEDRDEWLHRAYLYWTPTKRLALSAETVYDKFRNERDSNVQDLVPRRVETWSFPLNLRYFHPRGPFAGLGATYVDQEVRRSGSSPLAEGSSSFTVVDLALGWRFPKRRGIFSLSVQNLFDNGFDFEDDSYRSFSDQPVVGPYIPDRLFIGRLTLNF